MDITPQKLKFKCPEENCEAAYRKKWLLEDHIRKHYKQRPFHCNIGDCEKSFTKEPHLKRHKVMVHENACEVMCDVKGCGLAYNNKYSLRKHKNQVHSGSKYPFFCNECFLGYKKKWQLNQHNFVHTGEPPFKCTICNIGFTVQRDLTKHNRCHKTYFCACGGKFEKWSLLRDHKKTCFEKDVSENICTICAKKFTTKRNLKAHTAVHNDQKASFQCPYMGCSRSYLYKKNLNFHVSFYHEKQPHKEIPCPECGKIYFQQCFLNRHIKTMHSNPKIRKHPISRKEGRKLRKDKGKTKAYTAAALAGVKLSQKENLLILKNPKIVIPKIDLSTYRVGSSFNINIGKTISSTEPNYKDNFINEARAVQAEEKFETFLNKRKMVQGEDIGATPEIGDEIFSDELILQCNRALDRIEECLAKT